MREAGLFGGIREMSVIMDFLDDFFNRFGAIQKVAGLAILVFAWLLRYVIRDARLGRVRVPVVSSRMLLGVLVALGVYHLCPLFGPLIELLERIDPEVAFDYAAYILGLLQFVLWSALLVLSAWLLVVRHKGPTRE